MDTVSKIDGIEVTRLDHIIARIMFLIWQLVSKSAARALAALIPPPRMQLSEWIESNVLVATEPLKWYGDREDHPPWIKALAEVRQRATREGWCYHHVQAIILAIDQYRITAIGGKRHGDDYQGDLARIDFCI